MSFVWSDELLPIQEIDGTNWVHVIHLKKLWASQHGDVDRTYKISVAWIRKTGKRKWSLTFADLHETKQFSTLKAAKAYALATVVLGV